MNLEGITQPLHHVWERAGLVGHHVIEDITNLTQRVLHPGALGADYMDEALGRAGDQLAEEQGSPHQKRAGESWFMDFTIDA